MAKQDFLSKKIENKRGYAFSFTYKDNSILYFEHSKNDFESRFILNYNIYIPSDNTLVENVDPVMGFIQGLKEKQVRGFEQALKDAGQYYGSIWDGKDLPSEVNAWWGVNYMGKIQLDAKEIKKAIIERRLDSINIKTLVTSLLLREPHPIETFPYYSLPENPKTELKVNAFDSEIAEDLSVLLQNVCQTKVPTENVHYLTSSISDILKEYKTQIPVVTNPT